MLHTEALPPVPKPAAAVQGRAGVRATGGRRQPVVAEPARGDVASLEPLLAQVKEYLPAKDLKRIREAYRLSDQAHLGQFRSSGDPYITHPIAVAQICAGWHLDADVLMAALLHDVLEDTGVTKLELNERFGPSVAEMVDGLSKLDKIEFGNREQAQAESFRKMLLAMARDVRVILVKLADRLHNMRTLDAVSRHRQLRIASETTEIYAPIANRLGLHSLYRELQDLSFRYQYPMRYDALHKAVQNAGKVRRDALGRVTETVEKALAKMGVTAEISSREKSLYLHLSEDGGQEGLLLGSYRPVRDQARGAGPGAVLPRARRPAQYLQAQHQPVQGFHRHSQGERLPVAAYNGRRPTWWRHRIPDPHARDAPACRSGRRRALAVQGRRRDRQRPADQDARLAQVAAGCSTG